MCSSLKAGALLFLILNTLYSLRIIGLNQDEKSDGTGMAGLTFMFKQSVRNMKSNGSGEYNSYARHDIGTYLRNGGGMNAAVKAVMPYVKKVSQYLGQNNIGDRTNDKAFILSQYEINQARLDSSSVAGRGVGINKDEVYLYLSSNELASPGQNYIDLGLANAALRDTAPNDDKSSDAFEWVQNNGSVWRAWYLTPVDIVPCFCL